MLRVLSISRFKWNTLKLPEDFNIAPAAGYCSPGMDVNFIVSFQPTRHDSLIEGDVSVYDYPYTCAHKYSIFGERSRTFLLQYTPNTKVVYYVTQLLRNMSLSPYFWTVFNFPK